MEMFWTFVYVSLDVVGALVDFVDIIVDAVLSPDFLFLSAMFSFVMIMRWYEEMGFLT